jgi:RNA-splicing ligase RtcB
MLTNRNYHNCKLIKNQVDDLLHQMAVLFQNLGSDSTIEEYQEAYKKENELIDRIAELDPAKAQSIRPYAT